MTVHSVKHKRRVVGCFFLVLLLAFGIPFGIALSKRISQWQTPVKELAEPPAPPTYNVALTNLVRYRPYVAEIEANHRIELSSAVAEEIMNLYVDVGSIVTQNQLLLTFDTRYKKIELLEAQAVFTEALVAFSNAFLDLKNNQSLFDSGVIGDDTKRKYLVAYHNGLAARDRAEAQFDRAREQLSDCSVLSPCSGKISTRYVERNERVPLNQRLFTVVDDAFLKLVFFVEDRDIVSINPGQTGIFSVDSLSDTVFTAIVTAVGADVESETRLYRVEATYNNSNGLLKPGMVARVRIPVKEYINSVFIPSFALKLFGGGDYVSLYTPSSNYLIRVYTGDEFNDMVQIETGLEPGDKVLLR